MSWFCIRVVSLFVDLTYLLYMNKTTGYSVFMLSGREISLGSAVCIMHVLKTTSYILVRVQVTARILRETKETIMDSFPIRSKWTVSNSASKSIFMTTEQISSADESV